MQNVSIRYQPSLDSTVVDNLSSHASLVAKTANALEYNQAAHPLNELLLSVLQNKQDAEIEAALNGLSKNTNDNEPYYALQDHVESLAERHTYKDGASTLFVIPILGTIPRNKEEATGVLIADASFLPICQAFKELGLVGENGYVGLVPYLYHPVELGRLSYADTFELHQAIVNSALTKNKYTPEQLAQTGWPASSSANDSTGGPALCLRFLVGITFDNTENLVLVNDTSPLYTKAHADKMDMFVDKCSDSVNNFFRQFNSTSECIIDEPQLFFNGYRAGLVEVAQEALDAALAFDLAAAKVAPHGAVAAIYPLIVDGLLEGVTVSAISILTGRIIGTHSRRVHDFENYEELVEDLYCRMIDLNDFKDARIMGNPPIATVESLWGEEDSPDSDDEDIEPPPRRYLN